MYTPNERRFPSAVAAMLAAATMTFMTVAPQQETALFGGDTHVIASSDTPAPGICGERALVGCSPIRA
jgi:hypothetical protein